MYGIRGRGYSAAPTLLVSQTCSHAAPRPVRRGPDLTSEMFNHEFIVRDLRPADRRSPDRSISLTLPETGKALPTCDAGQQYPNVTGILDGPPGGNVVDPRGLGAGPLVAWSVETLFSALTATERRRRVARVRGYDRWRQP